MTAAQRKAIFGLKSKLGMDNDELHCLVYGVTGCDSLKNLTYKQAEDVIRELDSRRKNKKVPPEERDPKAYKSAVPGMMTTKQQSLAWRYIYRLQELDEKPMLHEDGKPYTVGERMAGAIHKLTGVTAKEGKDIFQWVDFENGEKLIEGLKRYVRSAERKAAKGAGKLALMSLCQSFLMNWQRHLLRHFMLPRLPSLLGFARLPQLTDLASLWLRISEYLQKYIAVNMHPWNMLGDNADGRISGKCSVRFGINFPLLSPAPAACRE